MTSLEQIQEHAADPMASTLAHPDKPAHRARDQIESNGGEQALQFDGDEPIGVDDQWKIINAYFD